MNGRAASAAIILCLLAPGVFPVALAGSDSAEFRHADKGLEAYRRVDFAAALDAWLPLARRGNARAQTWIGILHSQGKGVERDTAKAVRWLGRAASQGYAEAEYRLGVIHEFGHGMVEDKATALAYYERAANHAHVEAQLRLSALYEFGIGAAIDIVRADMWAEIAERIAGSHSERVRARGMRDSFAEIMTPEQAAEARRRVQAWIERRARSVRGD